MIFFPLQIVNLFVLMDIYTFYVFNRKLIILKQPPTFLFSQDGNNFDFAGPIMCFFECLVTMQMQRFQRKRKLVQFTVKALKILVLTVIKTCSISRLRLHINPLLNLTLSALCNIFLSTWIS